MTVSDLAARLRQPRRDVMAELWREVWSARVSADSFAPVRRGIRGRFRETAQAEHASGPASRRSPGGRSPRGQSRGAGGRGWRPGGEAEGLWFSLQDELECRERGDLVDRIELDKDRARVLLDRYGIVFRELLTDELPGFRWRSVFGALRLMELAGEVQVGQFFDGVPGVQFARSDAAARLEEVVAVAAPPVFFLNAADPASPCGWGLAALDYEVPRKHPGTYLAFHGERPALIARRRGSEVEISLPADHPALPDALRIFELLSGREFRPPSRITVRSINGTDPTASPYRPAFEAAGFVADYRSLVLWAGYR